MEKATYTGLDGEKFEVEYDPSGPCICCGLPVVAASVGGTVVCPWCDMGVLRDGSGDHVIRKHGPNNPHPKYLEFHGHDKSSYPKEK